MGAMQLKDFDKLVQRAIACAASSADNTLAITELDRCYTAADKLGAAAHGILEAYRPHFDVCADLNKERHETQS